MKIRQIEPIFIRDIMKMKFRQMVTLLMDHMEFIQIECLRLVIHHVHVSQG